MPGWRGQDNGNRRGRSECDKKKQSTILRGWRNNSHTEMRIHTKKRAHSHTMRFLNSNLFSRLFDSVVFDKQQVIILAAVSQECCFPFALARQLCIQENASFYAGCWDWSKSPIARCLAASKEFRACYIFLDICPVAALVDDIYTHASYSEPFDLERYNKT